jgi:methyl-accepting chemotaxis protein/PAS domain-containing protein
MDNNYKSLSTRLNPHLLKFGTKINILLLALLFVSILITSLVGFHYFKVYILRDNYTNLEQFAENKKHNIEKDLDVFLSKVPTLLSDDVLYSVSDLVSAFENYPSSRSQAFSDDSIKICSIELDTFYVNDLISKTYWNAPQLELIHAKSPTQIILQNSYLVNNPYETAERYKLNSVEDYTEYATLHSILQKKFKIIIDKNKLNNIYIIDSRQGNIVYNFNKNIAFGANVFNSFLKNSNLTTTYQKALSMSGSSGVVSDFENFIPEFNQPVAFIATPLNIDGERIAVMVLEVKPSFFESIIYSGITDIENNPVSYQIVGEDNIFRTNDIFQLVDKSGFIKLMGKQGKSNPDFDKAAKTGTGSLALSMDINFNTVGTYSFEIKNYLGKKAYLSFCPINFKGLKWYLVAQKSNAELLSYFHKVQLRILFVFILIIFVALVLTKFFRESIIRRLNLLKNSMQQLAQGITAGKLENKWHDELGATIDVFGDLNQRINNASDFALQLSEGNYQAVFDSQSDRDSFAKALNTLKQTLQNNKTEADKRAIEDAIRNWTNEGIAKFNDLLRQSNNDIQNLSYILIEHLIEYLGANLGGVFIVEGETDRNKQIKLIASYAYDRKKYEIKSIEIGEGLIGNCYLEKKPIHLKKIPEDYIEIGSGFGKTTPKSLYISPLMIDQEVLGFIELASIEDFEDYKIDFINKLAENIAATFATVNLNSKTAVLLEESKRRSYEIAQQEEEMRQNLEEMQATQEELARLRDEDEQRTDNLKQEIDHSKLVITQLINHIEGEVIIKNSSGIIMMANELAALRFNSTPEKLIGKTDNDIFTDDRAEKEHQFDLQTLSTGISSGEISELVNEQEQLYSFVKKQFYLPFIKDNGIITIRNKQ